MMPSIDRVGENGLKSSGGCKVAIRKDQHLAPVSQFVIEGLQIGQQVVAMAGPRFLRELAHRLGESGMRPEVMLRNGRLVFLTTPGCISTLLKPDDPLQRGGPVRTNAPLLRWVSDWSWAYGRGMEPSMALEYQRRVHDFTRSLGALSLCTAQGLELDRNSTLALLADHRRSLRPGERASHAAAPFDALGAGH
ncbi:MAG: MEDS domain-containing protein [Terriglobia bacterium]